MNIPDSGVILFPKETSLFDCSISFGYAVLIPSKVI